MTDADPTSTDSAEASRPDEPAPRRSFARLTAAPALALTALAAAPLAAAVRIAAHFGDPQTAAVLAEDCNNAFFSGALHTLKWPDCAGD